MFDAFRPPPGSCDCHVHVVGPKDRFPLAPALIYRPMEAPLAALSAMLARLGLERVVLVQPSFYGFDHACMVDALASLGANARGVAVLPEKVAPAELDALHRAGTRAIRVNMATFKNVPLDAIRGRLRAAAGMCARNGWHVQTFLPASAIEPLGTELLALPVEVAIDHFGLVAPADGNGPAADALVKLLSTGRIWLKLSAAYRIATDPYDPKVAPLARRMAAANPERVVWGSDWPHTPPHSGTTTTQAEERPYRDLDTKRILALVADWLPEASARGRLLVENPARLYGFA